MVLIQLPDRTYVIPSEPRLCGQCGAMSGVFVNRSGGTNCCRCDVEERTNEREGRPA
jgi:hypothetical protein